MTASDTHREQGVDFGGLVDDLAGESYPMGKAELVERYGDRKLDLEDGTRTLEEILGPIGEDSFESADAVIQSVIGMVGDAAVGRTEYTDRGGHTKVENETEESM